MENNEFKCTGDCLKCNPVQRAYCASQNTYNTMKMLEGVILDLGIINERLDCIMGDLRALKSQGDESLFSVMALSTSASNDDEMAQEGEAVQVEEEETIDLPKELDKGLTT